MAVDQTDNTAKSGELFFRVDSGLLFQLGEQLVAKRSVALAELVKNAYDADATEVVVRLENVSQEGGTIVVDDNGTGMTFKDVERAWMTIATPEKRYDPLSRGYRRSRTGAKGVGRFAARRIAKCLRLRTVAEIPGIPERELVEVEFHWDNFKDGQTIDSVGNRFRREPVAPNHALGTTLALLEVRDAWSEKDVHELQRNLNELISPFPGAITTEPEENGAVPDPGFSIKLESIEYPEYQGRLEEKFLRSAYATLFGFLDKDGTAEYELSFRRDQKKMSFKLPERKFPAVGATTFEIRIFLYAPEYFDGLDFNVTQARRIARERSGVRIFFENFRVPAYGEPGDDWLLLDSDRAGRLVGIPSFLKGLAEGLERPMLSAPGNNQLFGAVYLSREDNSNLQVTLSREKLLEADAFIQLREFIRAGIHWMTVVHAGKITSKTQVKRQPQDVAPTPKTKLAEAKMYAQAASRKLSERPEQSLPLTESEVAEPAPEILHWVRKTVEAIDATEEMLKMELEEHIAQVSMLRVLASTGTMIMLFQHQHGAILNGLRVAYHGLKDLAQQFQTESQANFEEWLSMLSGWIQDSRNQTELFGLMYGKASRDHRQSYALRPIVEGIRSAFNRYMQDRGIEFRNDVPLDLRTPPMFQCELTAILLNFMTNALKAIRERVAEKPEQTVAFSQARGIRVIGAREARTVKICFCDTGKGADKEKWEDYFEPFSGESQPDPILGHGTGLGLSIVKDLVESYGGEVRFVEPEQPWKTCIEVELPVEEA